MIDDPRNHLFSRYGFRCTNCFQPLYSLNEAKQMGVRGVPRGRDAILELGFCPNCGGFTDTISQRNLSDNYLTNEPLYTGQYETLDDAIEAFQSDRISRSLGMESRHRVQRNLKKHLGWIYRLSKNKDGNIDWDKWDQMIRDERDYLKLRDSLGLLDRD